MRTMITALLMLAVISIGVSTSHRVPQDFATIQLAINAAVNGDTVLVSEGKYFENLTINKKIVLGSLFIVDGDTSHISKTILDGGTPSNADSGSVIIITTGTDATTVIQGLTISRGKGTKVYSQYDQIYWIAGGGIFIPAGGATITNNRIVQNTITGNISFPDVYGGGIAICPYVGAISPWVIENNIIAQNTVTGRWAEDGGVFLSGTGKFINNKVISNSAIRVTNLGADYNGVGGGVNIAMTADIDVENNYISKNYSSNTGGAGVLSAYSGMIPHVRFKNNIVTENISSTASSFVILSGDYTFVNNTITGNSGKYGLSIYSSRGLLSCKMLNNIIWNPSATTAEFYLGSGTSPYVYGRYNCIRGGFTGTGNISNDPLFVQGDTLFRLTDSSPCLSAGIFQSSVDGTEIYAPLTDYLGNPRPRPVGMRSDLGAIEHDSGNVLDPTEVRDMTADHIPTSFMLSQNYPNPFNPSTTIRYALPERVAVRVSIHDLLGREIETLVDEEQTAGWKEVQWNAKDISSGVYFYSLKAGTFSEIKKMILIK